MPQSSDEYLNKMVLEDPVTAPEDSETVNTKEEFEDIPEISNLNSSNTQEEDKETVGSTYKHCGKTAKLKHHIKSHIDTDVEGVSY